jgi:hypothetical protein
MRYGAAEKLEIIRLVEQSSLSGGGPWPDSASRAPPSTLGMSATWRAAPGPWKMASRRRAGSGTKSRSRWLEQCLSSRSKSRSCHLANWHRVRRPAALLCLGIIGLSAPGGA